MTLKNHERSPLSPRERAGVRRESRDADSIFAMADVQAAAGLEFVRRTATGAGGTSSTASGSAPRWVRLTRTNNTFRAYSSTNGNTWTAIGSATTFTNGPPNP